MTTPQIEPYQPFPGFADFAGHDFELAAFDRYAQQLSEAKGQATPDRLAAAVERATKAAAVDTGAIEGLFDVDRGFTMTVATEAAAWESIHLQKGEQVARAIQDALRGYDYVLDLATGSRPITESWLRELHAELCRSQGTYKVITSQGAQTQPLPVGQYKQFPNNPLNLATGTIHAYAAPADTPAEMARLVGELGTQEFARAHPAVQAAYAHYAFVCVHPFADGNGRVARALASVYLYRTPGVPLVIFADQKAEYLDSLELADAGQPRAFVRFIADRAIDTVRMVVSDLDNAVPDDERIDHIERLRRSLVGRGGLSHDRVDALGIQLLGALQDALVRANAANPAPEPISISIRREVVRAGSSIAHLRPPADPGLVRAIAEVPAPMATSVTAGFFVFIAKPDFADYDFAVIRDNTVIGQFLVRDLEPSMSASAAYRLKVIAERQLWELTKQVGEAAEQELRNKGYR